MLGGVAGAVGALLATLVSPALGVVFGVALPAMAPWLAGRIAPPPPPPQPPPPPRVAVETLPPAVRVSGSWRGDNTAAEDTTSLALMLSQASLRQIGLSLERLAPAGSTASPFVTLARGALHRTREALSLLVPQRDLRDKAEPTREPFALREDLVAVARGVGFELGREVAVRFSSGFPAQSVGDRSIARLALTAMMLEAVRYLEQVRHDPLTQHTIEPIELLVDVTHEDIASQRALVRVVVDAQPDVPALPPPGPLSSPPAHLRALETLLKKSAAQAGMEAKTSPLIGTADGRRIGFEFQVVRYKRLTGTTLFGVGALADRAVLVIEPRTLSRVSICESLASWRLRPTAVSTIEDAVTLLTERTDSRPLGRFDMVVLAAGAGDAPCPLEALAQYAGVFAKLPIVTLEGLDCLARPLPAGAETLSIKRLPRPLGPTDLLEVATGALAPPPRPAPTRARSPETGLSVLVAEDNPVNQAFVVKLLERRGVSIILANNGADALDRVQETPDAFDAIFMDLQMPVMDGYEAAAVLRLREAQDGRPRVPIIAITAHALDGERERCLEAGMDDYLSKPVDEASLFAALSRVTQRQPEAPPASQAAFDRARVLDFAAGDKAFLDNLIALFSDTSPRQLEAIRAAITAQDGKALHRAAHQLKGSVSNFGAGTAVALAAKLETQGATHDMGESPATLEALEAEVIAVRVGLKELLKELK